MALSVRSHLPYSGTTALAFALLLAALVALIGPIDPAAAKHAKAPTVSSVGPAKAMVGDRLTVRGRNFRAGKGRNTVIFKRDGGRALFVKADLSTRKMLRVTVPARLETLLPVRDGARQYAQFRIRVLAGHLGRSFTPLSRSPHIGMPIAADGDCDADGRTNGVDDDDDNDLLSDRREREMRYPLLECDPDTDDDGVGDGYEFASARDLNDDDYQGANVDDDRSANTAIPYPASRPYPNPLDGKDAGTDFDGDSLTLTEEHTLWRFEMSSGRETSGPAIGDPALHDRFDLLDRLTYSDGEQYSISELCPSVTNPSACGPRDAGRRVPSLPAAGYGKHDQFVAWTKKAGYRRVHLTDASWWWAHRDTRNEYGLFDVDRLDGEEPWEILSFDRDKDGYLSDDERDEDADGLSNFDETHGRLRPSYWTTCYSEEAPYPVRYAGTNVTNSDSDGDDIRDGADDQDHDDVPNLMELSRINASPVDELHLAKRDCTPANGLHDSSTYGRVNPFNPCLPLGNPALDDPALVDLALSRTCKRVRDLSAPPAPFDGSPNWYALQ